MGGPGDRGGREDRAGALFRPGPVAGLLCGVGLGVSVFLLATLVHDRVLTRKPSGVPPAGFSFGGDARAPARVLSTLGTDGVRAVLLPLREDGGSTDAEEKVLNDALFAGQSPRRFARILVSNPRGAPPFTLDLRPGGVVLETGSGPVKNEDLAAALAARLPSLSAHRLLDLQVSHAADPTVEIPPGGFARALVAFRDGVDAREAAGASLAGGPRLLPREVAVEGLRAALLDGRIDALQDAVRAEAKRVPGAGSPPGAGGRR